MMKIGDGTLYYIDILVSSTVKTCTKEAGLIFTGLSSVTSHKDNNSTINKQVV